MLEWPPVNPPPSLAPNSASAPCFPLLRALFHDAYATMPEWVWDLPQQRQSDHVLRRVALVAQSCTPQGIERLCASHAVSEGEYKVVSALANLGPGIESFLCELHAMHPDEPFIARLLDPEDRRGRQPS